MKRTNNTKKILSGFILITLIYASCVTGDTDFPGSERKQIRNPDIAFPLTVNEKSPILIFPIHFDLFVQDQRKFAETTTETLKSNYGPGLLTGEPVRKLVGDLSRSLTYDLRRQVNINEFKMIHYAEINVNKLRKIIEKNSAAFSDLGQLLAQFQVSPPAESPEPDAVPGEPPPAESQTDPGPAATDDSGPAQSSEEPPAESPEPDAVPGEPPPAESQTAEPEDSVITENPASLPEDYTYNVSRVIVSVITEDLIDDIAYLTIFGGIFNLEDREIYSYALLKFPRDYELSFEEGASKYYNALIDSLITGQPLPPLPKKAAKPAPPAPQEAETTAPPAEGQEAETVVPPAEGQEQEAEDILPAEGQEAETVVPPAEDILPAEDQKSDADETPATTEETAPPMAETAGGKPEKEAAAPPPVDETQAPPPKEAQSDEPQPTESILSEEESALP